MIILPKTDKELAVEFACAYVSGWFSRENTKQCIDPETIKFLITDAYRAISALPKESDL